MSNFMLIVSVIQNAIIGSHVNVANNAIMNTIRQQVHDKSITDTIQEFVLKNQRENEDIRIVAKGNPYERCGLDIDARIPVINRFHAYAYGMYVLHGKKLSSSYACIHMLNGVGCGVIRDGKLINSYSTNGVCGLRKIKRLSDGKYMPIASIAGVKELLACKAKSKYSSLDEFIKNDNVFVMDVGDAISELILHEIPKDIMNIGINAYDNKMSFEAKNRILEAIKHSYNRKIKDYKYIHLCNMGNRNEEDVKSIGAASFDNHVVDSLDHIFVVDGLPGCGKSTCAKSLYRDLKDKNIKVGAMITSEILNDQGKRSGFKAFIDDDEHGIEVARCYCNDFDRSIYRVFGSYLVNHKNINDILVPIIWKLISENDVVIIDEVASMQLTSQNFNNTIRNILTGKKIIVFTAPRNAFNKGIVQSIKSKAMESNQLYTIDSGNRIGVIGQISDRIVIQVANGK